LFPGLRHKVLKKKRKSIEKTLKNTHSLTRTHTSCIMTDISFGTRGQAGLTDSSSWGSLVAVALDPSEAHKLRMLDINGTGQGGKNTKCDTQCEKKRNGKQKNTSGFFFVLKRKDKRFFFPEMWTVEKQQKQHTTHNKKRKCEEQI